MTTITNHEQAFEQLKAASGRNYSIRPTSCYLPNCPSIQYELYLVGPCVGGYVDCDGKVWSGKYNTEADAHRKGEVFIKTGVLPAFQKESREMVL
mgnify:FL=1